MVLVRSSNPDFYNKEMKGKVKKVKKKKERKEANCYINSKRG